MNTSENSKMRNINKKLVFNKYSMGMIMQYNVSYNGI